jgi:hypothetical protein
VNLLTPFSVNSLTPLSWQNNCVKVKRADFDLLIQNECIAAAFAANMLKTSVHLTARKPNTSTMHWAHSEQHLTSQGLSIVTDIESANGPQWSQYFMYVGRWVKYGNQNVCEILITFGVGRDGKPAGSGNAKTYSVGSEDVQPEWMFNLQHRRVIVQLCNATVNVENDTNFLPVRYAAVVPATDQERQLPELYWAVTADPMWDAFVQKFRSMPARMRNRNSATKLISNLMHQNLQHHPRVGMDHNIAKEKAELAGCSTTGHATARVLCSLNSANEENANVNVLKEERLQGILHGMETAGFRPGSTACFVVSSMGGHELLALWDRLETAGLIPACDDCTSTLKKPIADSHKIHCNDGNNTATVIALWGKHN